MERDQWYKPNLLYNIHYRPKNEQDPPKMIVETRVFNPSVCTCGKHGCDPHYRMERRVVWSRKSEDDAKKMKREINRHDTEDGHNDSISKEVDSADGEKVVANVGVKSVIGGIDEKSSGDSVNADSRKRNSVDCMENGDCDAGGGKRNSVDCIENGDCDAGGGKRNSVDCMENGDCDAGGGKRNSVDCMENGECGGNGVSGENEICNSTIDYGSIGNGPGGRSCIGNGEDRIGCGDDGCVDCMAAYGCIGKDPGGRSCIGNGEDKIGCGDDGCVDCMVGYGCIGNEPGGRSCIGNGEDRIGCGDDGCVDCMVGDICNSSGNDGGGHREEMCKSFGIISAYVHYWYGALGRSWQRLRREDGSIGT